MKRKRPPRATFVENDTETLALMEYAHLRYPQLHAYHTVSSNTRMTPARLRWLAARATYLLRKMEEEK